MGSSDGSPIGSFFFMVRDGLYKETQDDGLYNRYDDLKLSKISGG